MKKTHRRLKPFKDLSRSGRRYRLSRGRYAAVAKARRWRDHDRWLAWRRDYNARHREQNREWTRQYRLRKFGPPGDGAPQ